MQEDESFQTKDFDFAIVLLYFGVKLIRTDKQFKKVDFIFENDPRIEDLKTKYINDNLKVSPRKFLALVRQTKGLFIFN